MYPFTAEVGILLLLLLIPVLYSYFELHEINLLDVEKWLLRC